MAISKSTQSPLGWPLFIFLTPLTPPIFPHRNFPTLSHFLQFTHSFPAHHTMAISNHDRLGVGPNCPLSPPISPIAISPPISKWAHSFPPHTHNGNFQIKIARAHSKSATLFKLPIFPISRKKALKSVYIGAQHTMQYQTQCKQQNLHFTVYQYDSTVGQFYKQWIQTRENLGIFSHYDSCQAIYQLDCPLCI
ncbi:uncharacterized protein Gasu_39130 [Galdieria sulphuraria]|uniref:Uncharacterized protein n=1 Tax=Galdieria sulphuraria TaxID=130081 RepID=M2XYI8_GALSU|nr:uncharacterized protein Gasu_39130 [Galdieria sulphuraria]EME28534.1 hypothetical protein Gasu_39130 [Galdieria sulphuraria]|eukprot:XP_005705054.1 hypothetical protein Gasu_39130 [Galdieria sulphuraria]